MTKIEKLKKELAKVKRQFSLYKATSGDLCPVCGWRGIRDDGCDFCKVPKLEDKLRRAKDSMILCGRHTDAMRIIEKD